MIDATMQKIRVPENPCDPMYVLIPNRRVVPIAHYDFKTIGRKIVSKCWGVQPMFKLTATAKDTWRSSQLLNNVLSNMHTEVRP